NFAEFDVTEEFATWVDHVQSSLSEELVQGVLQFWRVVRVKHGIQVKRKGHACAAKFDNTLHGLETSGHADFVHLIAKTADIADHVYEPGLCELRSRDSSLFLLPSFIQLCLKAVDLFG